MSNITIYDIAKKTGFSPSTISKAINNYKGVNEKTKKIILDTMEDMHFTPNHVAQSLAKQNSRLLGVAYIEDNDTLSHPHFMDILQSFKTEVEKFGYDILLLNKNFEQSENNFYKHCLYRRVDGILLAIPDQFVSSVSEILTGSIPAVSVESIYKNIPTILSDNYNGTIKILEYLYSLGHRKIAYLSAPLTSQAGRERYQAYSDFVKDKKLPVTDKNIVYVSAYNVESAVIATEELLRNCSYSLPTAIATAYDEFAYATLETLTKRGYYVPEDISVTGFDNIIISRCSNPKITTMEQNRKQIGKLAAELLLDKINKKEQDTAYTIHRIPTKLITRNSTIRRNS